MYRQTENNWICNSCQKEFTSKQAVTSHIHRVHTKPGISYGGHQKGKPAWNKGIPCSEEQKQKLRKAAIGRPGTPHTQETKDKISKALSVNNKGGRSKWFDVNGQKVQGTWERNVAVILTQRNVKWEKLKTNRDTIEYIMDGKIRRYTPDFFLPELNKYLEIKGYWWGRDKEKMDAVMKQHPNLSIVIIEKKEYEKILQGELVW